MKILIAEDDPVAAKILRMALESFGHDVKHASNGLEAWTAFDRDPVRLVVSDWMMPGVDGLCFCHNIRSRGKPSPKTMIWPQLPGWMIFLLSLSIARPFGCACASPSEFLDSLLKSAN
jgi:CheY-like chemotaxis protein